MDHKFSIPTINLNSGVKNMPVLGFGTASDPPADSETTKRAVLDAIELGYQHFDTASLYKTEKPLGEAIREAINLGLIKSRDELFITSKLWCSDAHAQRVVPALNATLENLGVEYVDLYLIHWPVEVNPCWQQKELIQYCKDNGILVVGYSVLGSWRTFYGTVRVMESQVLKQIAEARGKTVAQVAMRWAYEQEIGFVVKSFNRERMKHNLDVFDWSLSREDVDKLNEIPQARACLGVDYTSPYGPYKTIQELWDGEI